MPQSQEVVATVLAPVTGGQTIHMNEPTTETPKPDYSRAMIEYQQMRRQRFIAARDMRDGVNKKWDDMPFLTWYEKMEEMDDQYVAPRKNAQDTSINLGTVRDKDTSIVGFIEKYDFVPMAEAYEDDSQAHSDDLAELGEDLVTKSLDMETFEDKKKLIARSMVSFGTALVEDRAIERWELIKDLGKNFTIGSSKPDWTERKGKCIVECDAKLWDLRKCYFGDIRKFFMNGPDGQPYFFTVEYEPYDKVKAQFGEFDMWKYVPRTIQYSQEVQNGMFSAAWTLRPLSMNYCEIIRYYDPVANEFALTINGIDMLPIMEKSTTIGGEQKTIISGFPLTAVSPSGAIPFAKFDNEPMHDFAYSKPTPAKMRVAADVENMIVKTFVWMFKQKARPTVGNKSGQMFGDEIYDSGTILSQIRDGDIFPVFANYQGATPADFQMFELFKKELDKNSIERRTQGMDAQQPADDESATANLNDMKTQSLKLMGALTGMMSGMNQLNWLRFYNIAANWTKAIDTRMDELNSTITETYRTIHLESDDAAGEPTTKRIAFTKGTTMTSMDVLQEEMDHEKETGKKINIKYVHPERLATAKVLIKFRSTPVPNDSDPISYMMFSKQVFDAQKMFGPESLQVKKLKRLFTKKTGNDFDTWFKSEDELQQDQQKMQQAQMQAAAAGQPQTPGMPQRPGAPVQPGQQNPNPNQNPAQTIGNIARGAMPQMAAVMK